MSGIDLLFTKSNKFTSNKIENILFITLQITNEEMPFMPVIYLHLGLR